MTPKPTQPPSDKLFAVPLICGVLLGNFITRNHHFGFWLSLAVLIVFEVMSYVRFQQLLNRHWTPKEGGQS